MEEKIFIHRPDGTIQEINLTGKDIKTVYLGSNKDPFFMTLDTEIFRMPAPKTAQED